MSLVRTIAAALGVTLTASALSASSAGAETVWLCKPGMKPNPCRQSPQTTFYSPSGESRVAKPQLARRPPIDCFYVYPTVSEQLSVNANRDIDPAQRAIARYQASRFSQRCRIFAPIYRQRTLLAVSAPAEQQEAALRLAYTDVRAAWRDYLRNLNRGRGVVLIGHSQGTTMLRQLLRKEIDPRPGARRRLVSAILLGGNVTVRKGQSSGGDFVNLSACASRSQTGCVIAYSAFNETPPDNARFGRPASPSGVNPFDLPTGPQYEVLCTNPGALGGGRGPLRTLVRTESYPGVIGLLLVQLYGGAPPDAPTPWVQPRDHYTGRCVRENEAQVLMVYPVGEARRLNSSPDDSWGLHLADVNIALGNLVRIVGFQVKAYLRRQHSGPSQPPGL